MSDEIIKVLDDLACRLGVTIDWTAENVMPYVEDLFHRWTILQIINNSILIVMEIVVVIGLIALAIKGVTSKDENSRWHKIFYEEPYGTLNPVFWMPYGAIAVLVLIVFFFDMGECGSNLLECIFTPEVSFAKMIVDLIK